MELFGLGSAARAAVNQQLSAFLFDHGSIWTALTGLEAGFTALGLCYVVGIILLTLCIECTLALEKGSTRRGLLLGIRSLLAIPAAVLYLDAISSPHITNHRHFASGIATIGLYGLFKTWAICFAPFLDGARLPSWVKTSTHARASNGTKPHSPRRTANGTQKGTRSEEGSGAWRYSMDLITTLRGVSWLGDRHFDFLAPHVVQEQAAPLTRVGFVRSRLLHLLLVCLCYDVCDSITKSRQWTRAEDLTFTITSTKQDFITLQSRAFDHQLTALPLYHQAVLVLIVAITTQLSLETFYTAFGLLCVGFLNVSPKAFPHFFSSPLSLHTDSVRAFWGARWHHIFRRVFDRAIDPWLHLCKISRWSAAGIVLKIVAVFTISSLFHTIIQARTLFHHYPSGTYPPLFDSSTLAFFLSQPLALCFEHLFVRRITRKLPHSMAYVVCRVWTWSWLFWSGRWWADTWVKMGMWQPDEQVVYFSPVRGILKGEWIVNQR